MGNFKLRITGDLGFEVWQDIAGFEGVYQVSTYGNVKSLERKVWNGRGYYVFKEGLKKLCPHKWGYYQIKLSVNNRDSMHLVHRLVAETFIPNFNNHPEIDHIDGNPVNNRVENLKWATHTENMNNPITKDRVSKKKGTRVIQYDLNGNYIDDYQSCRKAAGALKISASHIGDCARGIIPSYAGYVWKYV